MTSGDLYNSEEYQRRLRIIFEREEGYAPTGEVAVNVNADPFECDTCETDFSNVMLIDGLTGDMCFYSGGEKNFIADLDAIPDAD